MIDHKKYSYLDMPFDQNTAFLNPAHPEHTHDTRLRVFVRIARLLLGMDASIKASEEEGTSEKFMQHLLNTRISQKIWPDSFDWNDLPAIPKNTLVSRELGGAGRNTLIELQYNDYSVYLDVFVGGTGLPTEISINGWHFNSEAQQVIHDHAKAMDDAGGFWRELHGTVPLKFNI